MLQFTVLEQHQLQKHIGLSYFWNPAIVFCSLPVKHILKTQPKSQVSTKQCIHEHPAREQTPGASVMFLQGCPLNKWQHVLERSRLPCSSVGGSAASRTISLTPHLKRFRVLLEVACELISGHFQTHLLYIRSIWDVSSSFTWCF